MLPVVRLLIRETVHKPALLRVLIHIRYTDNNGCTASCTLTISEPAPLTASASSTDASCSVCTDGTVTIGGISGGTAPYTVSPASPQTGLAPGTYCFTVTDANGCTTSACATVGSGGCTLAATCSVDADVSCNGGSDGSASVSATGAVGSLGYSWSPSGGTAANATGLTAGTYTVTVTDLTSECTATCSVTISEPSALVLNCSGTDVTCNGNDDGTTTVSASGGTAPYTGTGTTTGLGGGTYTYTVTDANGCSATCSVTVNEPAAVGITATPAGTIQCFGGTVAVTVAIRFFLLSAPRSVTVLLHLAREGMLA